MIKPGSLVATTRTACWTYPEYPGSQKSRLLPDLIQIECPALCLAVIKDMVLILDSVTGKVFWLRKTFVYVQKKLR